MALEQAGLELVAQGASEFLSTLQQAQQGTSKFGQSAQAAASQATNMGGKLNEVLTGALRRVGEMALNATVELGKMAVDALGGMMAGAREAAQADADLNAVLKSTGGAAGMTKEQLDDLATSMASTSLFEDDAVKSGEAMLLTFTNIGAKTFPAATQAMVDLSQKMGGDLQGAAVQLGKALNDPIGGISALTRVGVSFTDEQKAQIEQMAKAGDTAGAQALILAELNREFGGTAQAARDAAGPQADLNQMWADLSDTVGGALNQALDDFLRWIIPIAQQWLPILGQAVQDVGNWLTTNLGPAVATVQGLLAAAAPVVQTVVTAVQNFLAGLQQSGGAADFFGEKFAQLQAALATIGGAIQSIVQTVFGNIQLFIQTHGEEIRGFLDRTWAGIQQIFSTVWEIIKTIVSAAVNFIQNTIVPIFQGIAAFLSSHGEEIQGVLGGAWGFIQSTIDTVIHTVQGILNTVMALIKGDWQGAWDSIKSTLQGIWDGITGPTGIIQKGVDLIKSIINLALSALGTSWDELWGGLSGTVTRIWNGIVDTIENAVNSVIDTINGLISEYNKIPIFGPIPLIPHVNLGGSSSAAGVTVYNYTYSPSYTMPVTTTASVGNIGYNFALMEAMAG